MNVSNWRPWSDGRGDLSEHSQENVGGGFDCDAWLSEEDTEDGASGMVEEPSPTNDPTKDASESAEPETKPGVSALGGSAVGLGLDLTNSLPWSGVAIEFESAASRGIAGFDFDTWLSWDREPPDQLLEEDTAGLITEAESSDARPAEGGGAIPAETEVAPPAEAGTNASAAGAGLAADTTAGGLSSSLFQRLEPIREFPGRLSERPAFPVTAFTAAVLVVVSLAVLGPWFGGLNVLELSSGSGDRDAVGPGSSTPTPPGTSVGTPAGANNEPVVNAVGGGEGGSSSSSLAAGELDSSSTPAPTPSDSGGSTQSASDNATPTPTDLEGTVNETLNDTGDTVIDTVDETINVTNDTISDTVDETNDTIDRLTDSTENVTNRSDDVVDLINETDDTVTTKTTETSDTTKTTETTDDTPTPVQSKTEVSTDVSLALIADGIAASIGVLVPTSPLR